MPSQCLSTAPRRALADIALELRRERIGLVLEQWEHENAGCDTAADACRGRIEAIDAKLRAIEEARGK